MEENLLPELPAYKLYKDRAIYVGTFLGGPLVAGYLAAENFKQLGQRDKVKTAWAIAAGTTILAVCLSLFVPAIGRTSNILIPLAYASLAKFLVQKFQGEAIKTHIESGGETYSNWRVVLIVLAGLAALLATVFVLTILINKI